MRQIFSFSIILFSFLIATLALAGCAAQSGQEKGTKEQYYSKAEANITDAADKPQQKVPQEIEKQNISAKYAPYPYANISAQKPRGAANPKIIMDEFLSFSCAVCKRAVNVTDRALRLNPELAIRYRHFPLPQTPNAYYAAQAFECAADQGKEWEIAPLLFADTTKFGISGLEATAAGAGLNSTLFNWCIETGAKKKIVDDDLEVVAARGMRGTPYFVIGNATIAKMGFEDEFLAEVYRAVKSQTAANS